MRTSVTIALPADVSASQLSAVAALLSAIEAGRWGQLAASFDRLDEKGARWPAPTAEVLDRLAVELRRAAADRREAAEELAEELEPATAPGAGPGSPPPAG